MKRKRLLELATEFDEWLMRLHTVYLDSIAGYFILHERLCLHQEEVRSVFGDHEFASEEFQNQCGISYSGISQIDVDPVSTKRFMKQGDLKNRVEKDGTNTLALGNQCVITAYSYWETYFRTEMRKATGDTPMEDLWGDLRIIRNSIIHHQSIANTDIEKCKLIKWFKPQDTIKLDYQKMRSIFFYMADFRNKIHELSLPKQSTFSVSST